MEEEKLLTVTEVATALGVSQAAVRNAIYEGRLASTKMYGKPLVKTIDLEAYRARSQPDGTKRVGRPPKQAG